MSLGSALAQLKTQPTAQATPAFLGRPLRLAHQVNESQMRRLPELNFAFSRLRGTLPRGTFRFDRLGGDQLIRLPDEIFELVGANGIETLDCYPVKLPHVVARGMDALALHQFGINFGRALESEASLAGDFQAGNNEHLAGNFEQQGLSPLQLLARLGKGQAVCADGVEVHGSVASSSCYGVRQDRDTDLPVLRLVPGLRPAPRPHPSSFSRGRW